MNIRKIINNFSKIRDSEKLVEYDFIKDLEKRGELFYFFPFELSNSVVNVSEYGENSFVVDNALLFKKLLTGTDTVLAKWENAYEITKGDEPDTLWKNMQVGRYLKGYVDLVTSGLSIIGDSFDKDFLTLNETKSFTAYFSEEPKNKDIYKLWYIPKFGKEAWFYINNGGLNKFYDTKGNFIRAEITFTKLTTELEKTGQSLETFIQKAAPGESYAWPKINFNNEVELDTEYLFNVKKVNQIQKEAQGVNAIISFYAIGRKAYKVEKYNPDPLRPDVFGYREKIETPRELWPFKIHEAIPSILTTKGQNVDNFYLIPFSICSYEVDYQSWKQALKETTYAPKQQYEYQGFLTSANNTKQEIKFLADPNLKVAYGYNEEKPYDYDIYSKYAKNDSPGKMIFGQLKFSVGASLVNARFITEHINTLPLAKGYNVSVGLADIPVIGGLLSKITLGIPVGWRQQNKVIEASPVPTLVPKSALDYSTAMLNSKSDIKIPLSFFEKEDSSIFQNTNNNISTNIRCELTDKFKDPGYGEWTTEQLQKGEHKWGAGCDLVQSDNDQGWIIDAIIDKSIGKNVVRYSCFDNDKETFAGIYQSKSKFTNNIRDYLNIIKFSNWKINKLDFGDEYNLDFKVFKNKNIEFNIKMFGHIGYIKDYKGDWKDYANYDLEQVIYTEAIDLPLNLSLDEIQKHFTKLDFGGKLQSVNLDRLSNNWTLIGQHFLDLENFRANNIAYNTAGRISVEPLYVFNTITAGGGLINIDLWNSKVVHDKSFVSWYVRYFNRQLVIQARLTTKFEFINFRKTNNRVMSIEKIMAAMNVTQPNTLYTWLSFKESAKNLNIETKLIKE